MRIAIVLFVLFTPLVGCVKRTISIQSTPSGALVWVNDREVGRTPLEFGFLYYGEYDIRLQKDGFEPILTTRWAKAPVWDAPMVDMFTEVVSRNLESRIAWAFSLEPRNDDLVELVDRAAILRYELKSDQQ